MNQILKNNQILKEKIQIIPDAFVIWERVKIALSWLVVLFPILIAAYYVYNTVVDIPYYDEWAFLPMIEKWNAGNGNYWDLFQQYQGYLIPVQRIVVLLNATFFSWDVRFEMVVGFLMLLGTASVFILYARRIGALSSAGTTILFMLPIMLLLFSLRQWENLIAPWAYSFFAPIFFVIAAGYLLSQSNNLLSLIGAIIYATLASLTFTNGLLIWPIGLTVLFVKGRRLHIFYWIIVGSIFLSIFFSLLGESLSHGKVNTNAILIFQRFFALLGAPLAMDKSIVTAGGSGIPAQPDFDMAILEGLFLFFISFYLLWELRKDIHHFLLPIVGVLFSLMSCMMIAYGRANFGLGQAFSSRYTTESLLLLISIIIIIVQLRLCGKRHSYLENGLLIVIILSSLYSSLVEIMMMPHRHDSLQKWANNIHAYAKGADLSNLHRTREQMYENAARLDRLKMSVFREHG